MTRTELKDAKNALINAGWVHSHSVMADKPDTNCFGLVFLRAGHKFYLNKNTIHLVEEMLPPSPVMTE